MSPATDDSRPRRFDAAAAVRARRRARCGLRRGLRAGRSRRTRCCVAIPVEGADMNTYAGPHNGPRPGHIG